jgi:hypothetical protein
MEYHSVCPLVGIGTPPPPPLPRGSVPLPPPGTKGEGAHSPAGEGVGCPNADDWRKSFALCLYSVGYTILRRNNTVTWALVMWKEPFSLEKGSCYSIFGYK